MSSGRGKDKGRVPPSPDAWLLSEKDLKQIEEFLDDELKVVTGVDIPYTAGYSKDGKTVYIDRDVPETIKIKAHNGTGTVEINLWKAFAVHEMTEKSLEDEPAYWPYEWSHEVATRAERLYVESVGADWNDYNAKTEKMVNAILKRGDYKNIPKDLDPEPYEQEGDEDLLEENDE